MTTENVNGISRQKVLIVANEWSRNGGLEIVTQDIARAFVELGLNVVVLPANGEGRSERLANGIRVLWLPPCGRFFRLLWRRFFKWSVLSVFIKWHLRDGGLLVLGHAHLLPLLDKLPNNPKFSRWLWVHGIDVWGGEAIKWSPYLNNLENIVAVSNYTANHVKKAGVTTRLSVLPNSVDVKWFTPTGTPGKIRRDEILICGRMSSQERYKGHEILFEALPLAEKILARELRLRVVGTGDDEGRLREKAKTMGLENKIIFAGRVSEDELLEAYRHCGVFVMPSRVEFRPDTCAWAGEGFGLVYIEAQACARPVVASGDGGAAETIVNEITGLFADPRSPKSNAEAIARILSNQDWADKLGDAGRKLAVERFSFENFRKGIAAMIAQDIKLS